MTAHGMTGVSTTCFLRLCSKKLGTPVPRLDLTPVLASMAAEQDSTPDTGPESHSHQGMLLLEDAPCRRLDMHGDADEAQQQPHSGKHSGEHRDDQQLKMLDYALTSQRAQGLHCRTRTCRAELDALVALVA
jgi:hypothetical protein